MAETKPKQQNQPKRKMPERRCVGCMGTFLKKDLIRVLRSPEGEISIDFTGKKSGRGAYICKNMACLKRVRKSRRLEHNLACAISPEVYDRMEAELSEEA